MNCPLLSIIVPTYNAEKVIKDCLQSIVQQTFGDYEIIIQDGGSTDGTLAIIEEIKESHPTVSIKAFSEKDSGIYHAMNKALKRITGEWVFFLGSDDRLYNGDVLQTLFGSDAHQGCDVVYGNVYSDRFGGLYGGAFDEHRLLENNICHQAVFFRMPLFGRIGGFNTRFIAQADWDHNLRWFFSKRIKKKYIDLTIAHYADGGLSSQQGDKTFQKVLKLRYLKYGAAALPFKKKLTLFREEFYRRRKSGTIKEVAEAFLYLPYLFR